MFDRISALLLAISAGVAMASPYPTAPKNGSINWFTCDQNATLPVTCGTLAVPLDYTDSKSTKTLNLQLTRFNATKQPSKGSILFNPGGPGESSREFLGSYAPEMMVATSGHYDLIAFETRGVGDTLPFSCFDSATEGAVLASLAPSTSNNSDTSIGDTWAVAKLLADYCYDKNKDIGELMSTAFISRDMMEIVDALGEDGMLRYYGFSYGTVLGATVAAMFPERIDKIIMDGVVNVQQWLAGSNNEEFAQTDEAVRQFFKDCLDAPDDCAIQRPNSTADELYDEVVDLLETTKFNPIVLGENATTSIVKYGDLKTTIWGGVKTGISEARLLAVYLNSVLERNVTTYLELSEALLTPGVPLYPNYGPEAQYGIQCPDIQTRTNDLESVEPWIEYSYNQSYYGGGANAGLMFPCVQWKLRSKETFTGPFQVKTKNPILFVNSPYDPATPLISAKNMTEQFKGSALLQHNGIGHCSLAQPSTCVIKATAAYFLNGTLPREGTVCEPDYNFLSNYTTAEIYKAAGSA